MVSKDSRVKMTVLKCGSEGVHLELYPGARGHTHTQFYLARGKNELGSFFPPHGNTVFPTSKQNPQLCFPTCETESVFEIGSSKGFQCLCLTHKSGSTPVFSSPVINPTSDTE